MAAERKRSGAGLRGITELVGKYEACVAMVAVARVAVAGMLPRGLELGEQGMTGSGEHPLLLAFGRHSEAYMTGLRWLPGFPMRYLELIAGVPFVRRAGKSDGAPYLHLVRLFLDRLLPVSGGLVFWGFPKEMARIEAGEGRFAVGAAGARLAELRYQGAGGFVGAEGFPLLAPTREAMSQVFLQKAVDLDVASRFDWGWEEAEIRPAAVDARVYEGFLPGMKAESFAVPGIDAAVLGGFELRTRWRLSLPYPP